MGNGGPMDVSDFFFLTVRSLEMLGVFLVIALFLITNDKQNLQIYLRILILISYTSILIMF